MGLFDYLTCEFSLEKNGVTFEEGNVYQTKSFYNNSEEYTITEDGCLFWHSKHFTDEDNPIEITNFTGTIDFYDEFEGEIFMFTAEFDEGILINIE